MLMSLINWRIYKIATNEILASSRDIEQARKRVDLYITTKSKGLSVQSFHKSRIPPDKPTYLH